MRGRADRGDDPLFPSLILQRRVDSVSARHIEPDGHGHGHFNFERTHFGLPDPMVTDPRSGAPMCAPATQAVKTYPAKIEGGRVCQALG